MRSVSDPGLGMGMRVMCFVRCGSMRCMRENSMMLAAMAVNWGGRRVSRLSVKPSHRDLLGQGWMSFSRSVVLVGCRVWRLRWKGQVRFGCGGGMWKMGARSWCAFVICVCM